jgi:hypothetical protein
MYRLLKSLQIDPQQFRQGASAQRSG